MRERMVQKHTRRSAALQALCSNPCDRCDIPQAIFKQSRQVLLQIDRVSVIVM